MVSHQFTESEIPLADYLWHPYLLLSPIDIAPDVFPIVGWIDDGILITLLITEVTQLIQGAVNRSEEPETADDDGDATVVDVQAQEVP